MLLIHIGAREGPRGNPVAFCAACPPLLFPETPRRMQPSARSKVQGIRLVPAAAGESPIAAADAAVNVTGPRHGLVGVGAVREGQVPEAVRSQGWPPVLLVVLVPSSRAARERERRGDNSGQDQRQNAALDSEHKKYNPHYVRAGPKPALDSERNTPTIVPSSVSPPPTGRASGGPREGKNTHTKRISQPARRIIRQAGECRAQASQPIYEKFSGT